MNDQIRALVKSFQRRWNATLAVKLAGVVCMKVVVGSETDRRRLAKTLRLQVVGFKA